MYTECPRKYYYHYKERLRSKEYKSFFLYGSAIDMALNHLLETKNLKEAIAKFDKSFRYNFINNVGTYMPEATNVVYAKGDFDEELLKDEDIEKYKELMGKLALWPETPIKDTYKSLIDQKAEKGFWKLTEDQRKLYSTINWLALRRKGHVMIESYYKKIIPRIKEVIKVQGRTKLTNTDGDSLIGILDLIIRWEDGKIYLMDNKTSARDYADDSAARSQQLIGYYHSVQEEYDLDGIGYFVMYKNILKNRVKICSSCGKDGSGQRHKTCDAVIEGSRCGAPWNESISPECDIEVIVDKVSQAAEDLVLETFDRANEGIKNEHFGPNLNACGSGDFRCPYFNKCWKGTNDELIQVEKKEK